MIRICEGLGVGAGKTYYLLHLVIEQLCAGGTVLYTDSLSLRREAILDYIEKKYDLIVEAEQFREFKAEDTVRLHEQIPRGTAGMPVLLLLDECHMQLSNTEWGDKNKATFFQWLTQSRHDDVDVVFTTQHSGNIDTKTRRLVTNFLVAVNMSTVKILGFITYKEDSIRLDTFLSDRKTRVGRRYLKKDPEKFALYDSKGERGKISKTTEEIERKVLKHKTGKNAMKLRNVIILAAIVLVALAAFLLNRIKKSFSPSTAEVSKTEELTSATKQGAQTEKKKVNEETKKHELESFELFRGTDGRNFLHTSEGNYYRGEWSKHGKCMSITGKSALFITTTKLIHIVNAYSSPPLLVDNASAK